MTEDRTRKPIDEWFGESIPAGESRDVKLTVSESYSSLNVKIPIHIRRAAEPGPVVFVTAALHGDEINGTGAVRQLIQDPDFRLLRGLADPGAGAEHPGLRPALALPARPPRPEPLVSRARRAAAWPAAWRGSSSRRSSCAATTASTCTRPRCAAPTSPTCGRTWPIPRCGRWPRPSGRRSSSTARARRAPSGPRPAAPAAPPSSWRAARSGRWNRASSNRRPGASATCCAAWTCSTARPGVRPSSW